jgi:hypothetical protein
VGIADGDIVSKRWIQDICNEPREAALLCEVAELLNAKVQIVILIPLLSVPFSMQSEPDICTPTAATSVPMLFKTATM